MDYKYAIVWRMDGSPGFRWYIQGILPDGRFWGDIVNYRARRGTSLQGKVTDWPRGQDLLRQIVDGPTLNPEPEPLFARVARYTTNVGKCEIMFDYRLGDERTSSKAQSLLELIELLKPDVEAAIVRLSNALDQPVGDGA
jgi:hypothetical protein